MRRAGGQDARRRRSRVPEADDPFMGPSIQGNTADCLTSQAVF